MIKQIEMEESIKFISKKMVQNEKYTQIHLKVDLYWMFGQIYHLFRLLMLEMNI